MKTRYAAVPAFITKDGSEIRELLACRNSGLRHQSLAEARLPVGGSTQEHYHVKTEEIYYLTHGRGRIRIEGEERAVNAGDAIAIPPGVHVLVARAPAEPWFIMLQTPKATTTIAAQMAMLRRFIRSNSSCASHP